MIILIKINIILFNYLIILINNFIYLFNNFIYFIKENSYINIIIITIIMEIINIIVR